MCTPKACYEEAVKQAEEWKIISFHLTKYFWHFGDLSGPEYQTKLWRR